MFYVTIMLLLMNNICRITEESPSRLQSMKNHRRSFAALMFTDSSNSFNNPKEINQCQWLTRLKYQNKLCRKKSVSGFPQVLLAAKRLAVRRCKETFKYDQWNCDERESDIFGKIYRETAYMYALSSSALAFSIAKACVDGSLSDCACGNPKKPPQESWKWAGCSDYTQYAKKFTRKFLHLKKNGDIVNKILRYNTEIGIMVVMNHEIRDCRCHGMSGSCSTKVCWKKILPYEEIANQLKIMYHQAVHVESRNGVRALIKQAKNDTKLLYMVESPNFCANTVGRLCKNPFNCATLCCGREFSTEVTTRHTRCQCSWKEHPLELVCQTCPINETVYRCK